MEKSKLSKVLLTVIMSAIMVFNFTSVFADDNTNTNLTDLTSQIGNTNSSSNSSSNSTNNTANTANNAAANLAANTANTANNAAKTNNASVYNNMNATNLPKTGIEDSIPVALLVVVFGISAVYAYKKVNDYRNI